MHAEAHFGTSCHYQIFFSLICFKQRLKRKDFPGMIRLTWAQEVRSSNLHAPTIFQPDSLPITQGIIEKA